MTFKTTRRGLYVIDRDEVLTSDTLKEYIEDHRANKRPRYIEQDNMYLGKHEILDLPSKEEYKPDNRIVVNFAKYIVDTLNGYFCGVPIKEVHEDDKINELVKDFQTINDINDNESEISKMCSVFGHAFEILYHDENSEVSSTYSNPVDMFIIYDDTVEQNPLYAVRYDIDKENEVTGTLYTEYYTTTFNKEYVISEDVEDYYFFGLPVIEFIENEERQSAFEQVETMINALNKAISEKANDVDYFSDAYLKILGADIDDDTITTIRDSRIINIAGEDTQKIVVEFMEKPNADTTQENLIDRLIDLIYQMSMTANVNDDTFSSGSSGTALEFKLQPMKNVASNKERKFVAALRKRYQLVFNVWSILGRVNEEECRGISYTFTRNIPQNTSAEAEVVGKLAGVVSKETQLSYLSSVEDPKAEIDKMEAEHSTAIKRQMEFAGYGDDE